MSTTHSASTLCAAQDPAARVYRQVTWRLIPLLLVCYLFAHLDRINIGFAKMQMAADLHLSDTVYGLGAGLIIAGMGASAALPMFWQLPPAYLNDRTQATGIALISSLGSVASFLTPYFIGWMRDTTHSPSLALHILALFIALGGLLVLRTRAATVNP